MSHDVSVSSFAHDMTVRLSCRAGDYLVWFAWSNVVGDDGGPVVRDMWELGDGDYVAITNRIEDWPPWFELHWTEARNTLALRMVAKLNEGYQPGEVVDGPNLWRIRAGDRLAWVGPSRPGRVSHDGILQILHFDECALAAGVTTRTLGLKDFIGFGSLTTAENPTGIAWCRAATKQIRVMGIPRRIGVDWGLG